MNARHILFRTDRFNLSLTKPHFINPDCFGEDLAAWLRGKLAARGFDSPHLGQEDWGWYLKVKSGNGSYLLGMNGIRSSDFRKTNLGEWRIIVKKNRSPFEWVNRKGRIQANDALLTAIQEALAAEPDFADVHLETVQGDL
jgi:hypothetical protein